MQQPRITIGQWTGIPVSVAWPHEAIVQGRKSPHEADAGLEWLLPRTWHQAQVGLGATAPSRHLLDTSRQLDRKVRQSIWSWIILNDGMVAEIEWDVVD